ncbi:MAG TPA: UDP-N-acetylglucosamine 1-carboxyvinyltransferase [Methylomirabilota bacterium]|jgi:UDP-N-acetylglucosamine 1-carboxyvinyltransferase|nr:UDP-N-acetylglucosamine 1-carboxyvinyltransferase [Methylomirabilota bacterium]
MPARLVVDGGVPLHGEVRASAAKNAALPLLAASLLSEAPIVLENVPRLADVATITELLRRLGTEVRYEDGATVARTPRVVSVEAPYELVSTMRASVLVLGPLVARAGRARVALPGGCAIGVRPIDLHLKGLERLGAEIQLSQGYVEARAARLKGARIVFDSVTVTGTENLMMAAALAEGTTVLENAAREPEIPDLARLLNAMGAKIQGAGTERIEIRGVEALAGARHRIIPDRVEAGTFLVAGAITGGDVTVRDVVPDHLTAILDKLEAAGARLDVGVDRIRVRANGRPRPTDIVTNPFPGFATDMQAQMMALLGLADGSSVITETIFENRFMHAAELRRLGASIEIDGHRAVIRGVEAYQAAPVMATDLRASASLVLGGLAARGTTVVSRVYHLDRGYEAMETKLAALGARIRRER